MVIVDGQPYSPAMPAALYDIAPPHIPGATQNISRGRIRVMGRAKTALMAVFLAAAVNILLARKLHAVTASPQGAPEQRRPCGPRARTRRLAAVREQRAAHAAEQAALAGPD